MEVSTESISLINEFWIVWWLFIIIIIWCIYYIPKAIKSHFDVVDKMRDDFTDTLKDITNSHKIIVDNIVNKFVLQIDQLWKDHVLQNQKLLDIHDDVKIIKNINNNNK